MKIELVRIARFLFSGHCTKQGNESFWEVENLPFFENISFAGLKSKFLSTQQKFYMSPTHPINMSSIGLKLMKIEQIKKPRFLIPLTVLHPVLKGKLKAEKEADKKAKVDPKLQAKKSLRNSRILYSVSKRGPRDPRRRNNLGFDNSYWDMKSCSISWEWWARVFILFS